MIQDLGLLRSSVDLYGPLREPQTPRDNPHPAMEAPNWRRSSLPPGFGDAGLDQRSAGF